MTLRQIALDTLHAFNSIYKEDQRGILVPSDTEMTPPYAAGILLQSEIVCDPTNGHTICARLWEDHKGRQIISLTTRWITSGGLIKYNGVDMAPKLEDMLVSDADFCKKYVDPAVCFMKAKIRMEAKNGN